MYPNIPAISEFFQNFNYTQIKAFSKFSSASQQKVQSPTNLFESINKEQPTPKETKHRFTSPIAYRFDNEIFNPQLITNAKLTITTEKDSPFAQALEKVTQIPFQNFETARCLPVFRDIIVFYDNKDVIQDVLQVCFSCAAIINKDGIPFLADNEMYVQLENLLNQQGHTTREEDAEQKERGKNDLSGNISMDLDNDTFF